MAITNGYCTLNELKIELSIDLNDLSDDTRLEMAVGAASRLIDGYCGLDHGFWVDGSVTDRQFYADDSRTVTIPDGISSTTGLVIKTDTDDDGTYETTLTIGTNFILAPVNAADQSPVAPYTQVRLVDYTGSWFPMSSSGRPGVQITAKFGWPTVPDDVKKACLIQSVLLFKASDAVTGALQMGESYGSYTAGSGWMNPTARALLERYCRPRVG